MTAKELLNPRFKVIAKYPNSPLEIGTILHYWVTNFYQNERDGNYFIIRIENIEDYPHIFRKMNWWENRKIEDMPKKLKSYLNEPPNEEIYEIVEWDMDNMLGYIDKKMRQVCDLTIFNPEFGYYPVD